MAFPLRGPYGQVFVRGVEVKATFRSVGKGVYIGELLYLVRGHHRLIPLRPQLLSADNLRALTASVQEAQNPGSVGAQAPRAAVSGTAETNAAAAANSGLKEIKVAHE